MKNLLLTVVIVGAGCRTASGQDDLDRLRAEVQANTASARLIMADGKRIPGDEGRECLTFSAPRRGPIRIGGNEADNLKEMATAATVNYVCTPSRDAEKVVRGLEGRVTPPYATQLQHILASTDWTIAEQRKAPAEKRRQQDEADAEQKRDQKLARAAEQPQQEAEALSAPASGPASHMERRKTEAEEGEAGKASLDLPVLWARAARHFLELPDCRSARGAEKRECLKHRRGLERELAQSKPSLRRSKDADCRAVARYGNNCQAAVTGAATHMIYNAMQADHLFIPYVVTNAPRRSLVTKVTLRIRTRGDYWRLKGGGKAVLLKEGARISSYYEAARVTVEVTDMYGGSWQE